MSAKDGDAGMNRRDLFKALLGGSASVVVLGSGVNVKLNEVKAQGVPSPKYGNPTFPLSDEDFNAAAKGDVSGKVAVLTGGRRASAEPQRTGRSGPSDLSRCTGD